jgi:hypothetical protein
MVCVHLVYAVLFIKHFNGTCGLFEEHQAVRVSHFDPEFNFVSGISSS